MLSMASKIGDNVASSESWISRAGVVVGYQPEDTMKSFIFNENNRHCLRVIDGAKTNVISLPQSDIERALDLLSSDDESDSSSVTKNTVQNRWFGTGPVDASGESEKQMCDRKHEEKMLNWCDQEENDSTAADFSSDLGESEMERNDIAVSNKSFAEILEIKLQQEKSNRTEKFNPKIESAQRPKFTFLRKNNGKAAWCSNVKKDVKPSTARSHSSDRETAKMSTEQTSGNNCKPPLRRMKSMPSVPKKASMGALITDDRPVKSVQKTVHFAERSDHETSNETLDTVRSYSTDKSNNFSKEVSKSKPQDCPVNEEVDKELVEFELLEQIANVSMSSTTSSIARFDEDMLRERVLKIQKMPPPKVHSNYLDDKRTTEKNTKALFGHSKFPACTGIVEELQANSAYDSDRDDDSESTCSYSTTLSKFKENIVHQSEKLPSANPAKPNPTRKVSKQDDRQKSNYPQTSFDNDDSWIDESPFQLVGKKCDSLEQTQNNSAHNLPPVKWTFADPFHQSDLSSDDEKPKIVTQRRENTEIEDIFPNIIIDKKQANPDENVGVQSAKLKQWIQLLETEIKRFNKENEDIAKIKSEQEQGLKRLENEMNEFSKHKKEEARQFEEFRQTEMKRLKKERKVFEEYQEAMKNMPNKKDREEIEKLKMEIQSLKEETVNKETRWQSANTRLKQKIEQLESENADMHSRIHSLEQKRLQLQAQLISNSGQGHAKPPDSGNTKHKPSVTSVSQAVSMKHTNNPISCTPKDDNNNNKNINSQRTLIQNKRPPSKIPNPASKVTKVILKPDQVYAEHGRIDVRGSAASDYYTGEDESGSTDSHLNRMPITSTIRESSPTFPAANVQSSAPYSMKINRNNDIVKNEMHHQDGILERVYNSGGVDVIYPNGSLKQISSDGKSVIIHLYNGDIKQITPDGRVVYFYSQDESTQTTFSDGREEIVYKNGQKDVSHPSGIREVHFPDQSIKIAHPDGREENILPNGLVIRLNGSGDKEILLPNGQREIHANGIKKRIYPDGTTKTVYSDGRQETYYASGRMRVKDRHGALILDQFIEKVLPTPNVNEHL